MGVTWSQKVVEQIMAMGNGASLPLGTSGEIAQDMVWSPPPREEREPGYLSTPSLAEGCSQGC